MAKKRVEPFNPWPSFVDLFASVIMVVLMFMLVLIVNITYYSQFRYKISYTGTVAIKEMTIKPLVSKVEPLLQSDSKEKIMPSAGADYSNVQNNFVRQENLIYDDWMIIKYLGNEVILDTKSIEDIDKFLKNAKEKFYGHYVSLYIKEPKNQVSASVSKQLALSRIINIRNLIRKFDYRNDDVVVRLKENIPQKNLVEHESGYAVILINRKK
ncbi:MAG: hypothetical protein M0Q24_00275 [Sulfurimonas sp.]|uniref:hypothetical protein n=1 Tax=Sulfurimonas sp. TaxID=2022749 RepID=UPI0025CD4DA1|nr:hypothetical protein [Sulfurimonas sp.]MCK9490495.1 hypothetical protein [Sulfurimonas sp.]